MVRFRLLLLDFLLLAACTPQKADQPQPPGSEARHDTNVDGETWHATTRLRGSVTSRPSWVTIDEDVRLDRTGRLVFSETRSRDDLGTPELRVTLDPPAHKVIVQRGARRVEWEVQGDEAWCPAAAVGPTGDPVATPLVAWTIYRAAKDQEWLRLVRPIQQQSMVVPRDQYVVGPTVIVGDQAVEVDERFVRAIQIGGTTLARASLGETFRFQGG